MKKLLLIAGMIGAVAVGNAATFDFTRITDNAPTDIASQFSVDVSLVDARAYFHFVNAGPTASGISQIYFDDASPELLNSIDHFNVGSGENIVSFTTVGVHPANLPGGNTVGFEASLRAGANNGDGGINRVGPGEYLGIYVNLLGGFDVDDVVEALENGDLRIGLHVQSIGTSGRSDSFVSRPPQVPDASTTAMLLGVALLGLEGLRRRIAK